MTSARVRVETLVEALPYIERFAGHSVVIKAGGRAMEEENLKRSLLQDLVLLQRVGLKPVLVHGGGPEIDRWMERVGMQPKFIRGLRVTDEATMELVEMVLCGKINKDLVATLQSLGGAAVGLSGKDGGLLRARLRRSKGGEDLGRVGEVTSVCTDVLEGLTRQGYIPVVATVSADEKGRALNINADHAAGALAAALGALKLIILTDVAGVLGEVGKPDSLISCLTTRQAQRLLSGGKVERGMIPKLEACLTALKGGAQAAHIIGGLSPHALLMELFTDKGIGTMVVKPG